jgi:hypothetical protein
MYVPDAPRFRPSFLASEAATDLPWLASDDWFPPGARELYVNARTALAAGLARNDASNGTVLLPAYAPAGLLAPFRARRFDVEWYPVAADLTVPVDPATKRIREIDPDVFVYVNFFGFRDPNLAAVRECARRANATVIADCARGAFARDERGRPLGTSADIAVFSLHKTLPVPNGGLLVQANGQPPPPTARVSECRDLVVSAAVSVARWLGVRPTTSPGPPRLEPAAASEASADATATVTPDSLPAPGRLTRRGLAACDPASICRTRRRRYRAVRAVFQTAAGIDVLTPPAHDHACPYGVAVCTTDRANRTRLFRLLYRAGLPTAVLQWPLRADHAATADGGRLRNTILVVPTHQQAPAGIPDRLRSVVSRFEGPAATRG